MLRNSVSRIWAVAFIALALCIAAPATQAHANPLDAIASFFGFGADDEQIEPAAAFGETTTADPNTMDTWKGLAEKTTENIGRIWTDKTVSDTNITLPATGEPGSGEHEILKGDDSDFLIGLSALSSTSNMISTTSKPLDIVLVLDVSGSMSSNNFGDGGYSPVYESELNTDNTYYIQNGNRYRDVEWHNFGSRRDPDYAWGYSPSWGSDWTRVDPKNSEEDDSGVQLYTYVRTRMDALKVAANGFISETAKQNDAIADAAQRHRISVVKFADDSYREAYGDDRFQQGWNQYYNYTQRLNSLTAYTSDNVSELTGDVAGIVAGGATAADYGMNMAQREFGDSPRPAGQEAQQVIIFFTDGEPNHSNNFSEEVAKNAIRTSSEFKNAGAFVYTIGVFNGADPDDLGSSQDNRTNRYMHAISSNYPNATGYETQDMGNRAPESNYYRTAADADSLSQVFEDIFEEISTPSLSPITSTHGATPDDLDTVTFTDELGAYMQVDSFKEIVYADQVFEPQGEPQTENGVTTYRYSGKAGNPAYPEGDLSQIIVEVKHSDDLAKGDIVTVKIPASVLPLRSFTVETDVEGNEVLTVDEQYPIRIFYGVSLKDEVAETLADGICIDPEHDHYAQDQALGSYIMENYEDGKVPFYSNYYNSNKAPYNGKMLGDTTAQFVPASTNSFYYFTEDTPVFVDEECKTRLKANELDYAQSYYYEVPYFELDENGDTVSGKRVVKFNGKNFGYGDFNLGADDNGDAFIKKGAPRMTRIDALTYGKDENKTDTADEVINPLWDEQFNALNVYLGNNGKLDFELAGALAITKDARIAPNKNIDPSVTKDKDFTFELTIDALANRTVKGEIRTLAGEQAQSHGAVEIKFDGNGKASYSEAGGDKPLTLQDDETLYIYGLDAGVGYSVNEVTDEKTMPKGFKLTGITVEGTAQTDLDVPVMGTIEAGQPDEIVFTNTYDVEDVTLEDEPDTIAFAGYEKNFDRWDVENEFTFTLTASYGAPMPDDYTGDGNVMDVKVTKDNKKGSFGPVTFDAVDVYRYTISEVRPGTIKPGMTYSNDTYIVYVNVTDNGEGALVAESTMYKRGATDPIVNKVALFTNGFSAESAMAAPDATKVYVNNSGAADKNLTDGMFSFVMAPATGNPDNDPIKDLKDFDTENNQLVVKNAGADVPFPQMTFTDNMVTADGTKYVYTLSEVIPAEASAENGYKLNGMTYDPTTYEVEFIVSTQTVGNEDRVSVAMTYYKLDKGGSRGDALQGNDIPEFYNEYNVDPVEIPGEGGDIKGRKTLVGRDLLDDESYSFTMTAGDNPTADALANGAIMFGDKGDMSLTEVVDSMEDRVAEFSFGNITFTKPGTYVFRVKEDVPTDPKGGMIYDTGRTVEVTVPVVDDNGALKLGAVEYKGSADDATDVAAFVNRYEASTQFGDNTNLTVVKQMTGRDLKAGEFDFTITAADEQVSGVTIDEAADKLLPADKAFSNTTAVDGVATMPNKLSGMRFDQDDAGKTFTYVVAEVTPAENDELPGVMYDGNKHTVAITVNDDGQGNLSTSTTVDGSQVTIATASVTFTNEYKPIAATLDTDAEFGVSKKFIGRDWEDTDIFTFELKGENGAPMPEDANEGVSTVSVSSVDVPEGSDTAPVEFGTIKFEAAGVYQYVVTEVEPNDKIPGVEYDGRTVRFKVTVTDLGQDGNHTGVLTATVSGPSNRTFTNEYGAQLANEDTSPIRLTKKLDGRNMNAGEFEFAFESLEGEGTTVQNAMDKVGFDENPQKISNKEGADAGAEYVVYNDVFGKMEFDSTDLGKTYKYKVSEVKPEDGALKGVVYDSTEYTLDISVVDNGDGTLKQITKVKPSDGEAFTVKSSEAISLAFENSYDAGEITVDLDDAEAGANLAKILKGRDWIESDSFEFQVTEQAENGPVLKNPSALRGTGEGYRDSDSVAIELGKLTFDKADTYTYKVKEVIPEGADADNDWTLNGITYDTHEAVITIEVTDNLKGELSAKVSVENAIFTNTYEDGEITVNLDTGTGAHLTKILNGRDWLDTDSFEFTVTEQPKDGPVLKNPDPLTAEGTADGAPVTIKLGELTFSQEGTYTYKVKEVAPAGANAGNGWTLNGITYDTHEATITIKVTDNKNGTLSAEVDVAKGDFTNWYASAQFEGVPAEFNLTKVLEGKTWDETDEFTFELKGVSDNAADVVRTKTVGHNDAKDNKATIDFGSFTYTQPGDYVYEVNEIPGKNTGIKYDNHTAKITVTVEHDYATGKLIANAVVANGEFKNTYSADLDYGAAGGLKISKVLEGRDMTDGQFSFVVKAKDDPSAEKLGVTADGVEFKAPAANDGDSALVSLLPEKGLTFTQADHGKTYTYEVNEVNGGVGGYTYDNTVYNVTIYVTDNNDGTLTATTTVKGGTEEKVYTYISDKQTSEAVVLPFVNRYDASTEAEGGTAASFEVTKTLTGRPLEADEFTFEVKPQGVKGADAVATATNDANGTVSFGPIDYDIASLKAAQAAGYADKSGDVWTLKYTASEVTDGLASTGITATNMSFNFTVSVTDNGNGTLTAAVSLPEGAGFENTYATGDTPASINLKGTKVLDRNGLTGPETIEGKFEFIVEGEEGAPMPEATKVSCDAKGNVDFGTIEFTLDDLNAKLGFAAAEASEDVEGEQPEARVGKPRFAQFTYAVTEHGSLPGVTNDSDSTKTVVFTVTDDGAGNLSVARTSEGETAFTFTNTYGINNPTPSSVTDQLEVTKTLTGRDMVDGEFAFELVDGTGTVVAKGVNAAGKVVMDPITYTEVGEHDYILREVDTSKGVDNGVEYDTTEYKVHTSVTDNRKGGLTVTHEFVGLDGAAEFENTYKPEETFIDIPVTKVLTGRDLVEGEFEFILTEDGEEVSTLKNDDDGKGMYFDRITYDKVGEHLYEITEKKGDAEGVTYDDTVFTMKVVVTDDLKGQLEIDWEAGENGLPLFRNSYEEPAKPEPKPEPENKLPGTGDDSLLAVAGLGATGVAAIAVGVYQAKRKRDSE